MDPQAQTAWKSALVIGDDAAARVLTAYYAVPSRKRDDLALLSRLAGLNTGIGNIMERLGAAGMLDPKATEPPMIVKQLIAQYVSTRIAGKKAR